MLITLETALLAKEKGFKMNSCTFYQHNPVGEKRYELVGEDSEDEGFVSEDPKNRTAVCCQFVLQKWLRESHGINILISPSQSNGEPITYQYCLHYKYGAQSKMTPWSTNRYPTYEEALEFGLQESLKLI